jgi:hypothetical protein
MAAIAMTAAGTTHAQTAVIGNWESATPEGWLDWGTGGQPPVGPPRYAFNSTGATLGNTALQFNHPGNFAQWAAIKLQSAGNGGVGEWRDDFMNNTKLAVDVTFDRAEIPQAVTFGRIGLVFNSDGYSNFSGAATPESVTAFPGNNGSGNFNPAMLPAGTTTSTWVWDISFLHDGNAGNGELNNQPNPNYIELIFDTFTNGGVPLAYHIDNVRLFTPIPEPGAAALIGLAAPALVAAYRRQRNRV